MVKFNKMLENKTVLIVEDNQILIALLEDFLLKQKMIIDYANDGLDAIEKITRNRPDVVLMDIMMPVMDGFEAMSIIRAKEDEYFKKLPMIAVTGLQGRDDEEKCYKAGANYYMSKPILLQELIDKITELLS